MQHIAFRVDSSIIIGYGHLMRCLTLAQALSHELKAITNTDNNEALLISFICRDHPGHINQQILDAGFNLLQLPSVTQEINPKSSHSWLGTTFKQDSQQCVTLLKNLPAITLLVVDHYAIDYKWHALMKPYYQKLLVVDDLANRTLSCDYLLDQTYNRSSEAYKKLVPEHCQLLLGQSYILLRDEFLLLKEQAKNQRKKFIKQGCNELSPMKIIITMGGTDPDNLSQLALLAIEALVKIQHKVTVNVVVSSQSVHLRSLTTFCDKRTWLNIIIDSNKMSSLMLSADIAIGASGGTAWERCCLGLPCLTTVNAQNQALIANNLAQAGATINLGWYKDVTTHTIISAIKNLTGNLERYKNMSNACFSICDGKGASRVAKTLTGHLISTTDNITFTLAKKADCQLIYRWQSNTKIRKYFTNPTTPSWQEHIQWYDSCLADPNRRLYLLLDNQGNKVGLLRLDTLTKNESYIKGNIEDNIKENIMLAPAYEISIIITPEYQGKGMAVNTLKTLKLLNRDATYIATIHNKNIQSRKAFINAGFKQSTLSTYNLIIKDFEIMDFTINNRELLP